MAKDFLENLFDSIDLIVTNKLGDLNYDKTEQCTIQEVKGNNEYYVFNGAAKYVAYAQNDAQYKEGDSVYVTIPQGNYNNQKLIIGKHAAKDTTATDWVSPMENFVNITGRINSPHRKVGLIANNPDEKIVHIWTDTRKEPYTGYDRLCLTADFSTAFKDLVIDGSYGIILTGEIEDARLETEIADLSKKWNEELTNLGPDASDEDKQKINDKYSNLLQKIKEKYQNIGITIDDNVQNFACLLDVKDMIGNPYDFGVPFMQEKLFEVEPTSKISKLALYFYQGPISDQTWNPNLITNNNNLYSEEENDYEKINFIYNNENPQGTFDEDSVPDLFVENITVNFGYSYETYSTDTAILYTLDKTVYKKDGIEDGSRELRLRWVYYDDNQKPHSITDINSSLLNYHYVSIHWYRYNAKLSSTTPDPLAGYFWEEIISNKNSFTYNTKLNLDWREEKFKVIIQLDEKLIRSDELIFSNPDGIAQYGQLITGLKINYPEDDPYKGMFYIYGDDHNASFNTEKTFTLIADYTSLDTSVSIWDTTDVICWKFPAERTLIHYPEQNFEFDTEAGDVFIPAGAEGTNPQEVNGVIFKATPEYHQIIRRIKIDATTNDSYNTRIQRYRVKGMFDSSVNNTIKCEVYKPEVDGINAEITFLFGLHTTNGTKYTMVVDWVETATVDGKECQYHRPPAITMGETKYWDFSVKILDSSQKEIEPPNKETGWQFSLKWYEDRIVNPVKPTDKVNKIFPLTTNGKRLSVSTSLGDYTNYINFAQYQILEIKLNVGQFDYQLTTRMPIPVRRRREIAGIEGADRIYYDSAGYNPKWNNKVYSLFWRMDAQNVINDPTWGIKNTDPDFKSKEPYGKYRPTYYPNLKTRDKEEDEGSYLFPPDTFLPRVVNTDDKTPNDYEGVCVFAKNGDEVLWVQPIYVTMNPYGSQFFNEWDGKMVIDEENNLIMSSVIGAGKKDTNNTYSGVILGEVNKVLNTSGVEPSDSGKNTGILGFHQGVQSFGFLNNGTGFIGKSGSGQIKFDGTHGYIMSGNFNGFNYNKTGHTNGIPQWNAADGTEKFIDGFGVYDKAAGKVPDDKVPKGTYLGLTTGNAYFAGTIYAKSGNIGGWQLASSYLYSKTNDKYTLIKSGGQVGIALAVPEESWESSTSTNGSNVLIYHNGKIKLGYTGKDGNLKDSNGNYYTGDDAYSIVINNGNAKFSGTIYSGAGEIGGWEITSTALKTKDVAITSNASGSVALSNEVFKRTIGGTERKNLMFAIGADFGVTNTGTVYAKNADITGNIYADYIKADDGTIGGWTIGTSTISGGQTTLNSNGSISIRPGTKYFVSMGVTSQYLSTGGLNVGKGVSGDGIHVYSGGLQLDAGCGAKFYDIVDCHGGYQIEGITGWSPGATSLINIHQIEDISLSGTNTPTGALNKVIVSLKYKTGTIKARGGIIIDAYWNKASTTQTATVEVVTSVNGIHSISTSKT